MAMVKCPECGRDISSAAKSCPHCGCVVTVCPDCGAVYAESKEVCDNCGCILRTEKTVSTQKEAEQKNKTLIRLKRLGSVEILMTVFFIMFALLSMVFFLYLIPHEAKNLMQSSPDIIEMKAKCDGLRSLIIMTAIFGCFFGSFHFCLIVYRRIFAHLIKEDRETYRKYLLSEKKASRQHWAVEFLELPEKSFRKYVLTLLMLILAVIGCILLAIWATNAVNDFWLQWMFASEINKVKLEWNFRDILFILGIVCWVGNYVIMFVYQTGYSNTAYNDIRVELNKEK